MNTSCASSIRTEIGYLNEETEDIGRAASCGNMVLNTIDIELHLAHTVMFLKCTANKTRELEQLIGKTIYIYIKYISYNVDIIYVY